MDKPAISVLLPVYNGTRFLKKAIDSILHQTFRDFELIIINDGSTDNSDEIIHLYQDSRIVYLINEVNKGLIYTLNRGIDIAKSDYIARMDADDISLPERLEKQKHYLDIHKNLAVVASTIIFINENEEKGSGWALDKQTIDPKTIRNAMVKENCIAHPSIMARTPILKKYKYRTNQKNIEDYDLWLRMLNHGLIIGKIEEPLLLYRVHEESVTLKHLQTKNFFFKHARMKEQFLANELKQGQMNSFTFRVFISMVMDIIKGTGKEIKKIAKK